MEIDAVSTDLGELAHSSCGRNRRPDGRSENIDPLPSDGPDAERELIRRSWDEPGRTLRNAWRWGHRGGPFWKEQVARQAAPAPSLTASWSGLPAGDNYA